MHAEIISIGTELTTGAKLDTNSQWLSLELSAVGIPVHYHTTVADDLEANVAVLRNAVERADVVLITGGLGPTLDDLTREALAGVMGVPLVLHDPSLEIIRSMFARRGRPMPERNVAQAMFPEGSGPIPNPRGTAPGIYVEMLRADGGNGVCKIAAMPGVPTEMKGMFRDEVLPRIAGPEARGVVIRHARVNCFGLGESAAEEMLGDVTARGRDPEVGITVHEATITLRIAAHAASVEECEQKIAATKAVIRERLGGHVFGEEDEELQHAVVRLLNERKLTLSTAESATGGLVASRLAEVPDHETCFAGGAIVSTAAAKAALFHVAATEADVGALAAACRRTFATDFTLAVGDAPPLDPSESAPAPITFIALASTTGIDTRELNLAGDPAIAKSRLAKSALNLLRLHLLKPIV